MINKTKLFQLLNNQKIDYKVYNHPPLYSVRDSINMRGIIEGAHTKNLFLKNKKNKFFLFSCLENTVINLKLLKKNLKVGNLSFAGENYLKEILLLSPGSVSPFGLLNDNENRVDFYLDQKLTSHEVINFHPLENTSTISLSLKKFIYFMSMHKKLVKFINFDNYKIKDEPSN